MTTDIQMTLDRKGWKKLIVEMLEKDEVTIRFLKEDMKVKLVKIED